MADRLKLLRIDTRQANVRQALADLRERLSPRGNVVSEAGRRRTIEVFGEPLSPQQVVERICHDVRTKGLPAVLDYSARIDKANLTRETIRVSEAELAGSPPGCKPAVSGDDPADSRQHFAISNGHIAARRANRFARRAAICGNAICRLSAWEFAFPAERRRIRRRC